MMNEGGSKKSLWGVITASSVGTLIEWYDFYIFGSLAVIISTKFFPQDNTSAAFLSTLATFAAGFIVRPFGALLFGRLGDLVGRKYTFMTTLLLMGGSTFLIGCVPDYNSIGFAAPLIVLLLRLLQGLALGGEYGGAATYVAEFAPENKRGFWTSWIQTTASLGLLVSLGVILTTRNILGEEAFNDWGWRIPFWVSSIMVIISYVIRKNMGESPLFTKAKAEGTLSKNPLKESFTNKYNLKFVLLALFGAVMGQGVIWYTGSFYVMSFIGKICGVNSQQTDAIIVTSLVFALPFFVLFGSLSDRIGRKKVMLTGMLLAVITYLPIYQSIYKVIDCSKRTAIQNEITQSKTLINGTVRDSLTTVTAQIIYSDGTQMSTTTKTTAYALPSKKMITEEFKSIELNKRDFWMLVALIFIQVIFLTMVYGPIAAFLVEMFPTKIRYTSMSLPYHIGNGVFGGLLPAVSTYLVNHAKANNNEYWYLQGLWYPIIIGGVCFIIGLIYLKNTNKTLNN